MPPIPLKWLVSGIAVLLVIAAAYFAVQKYNNTIEENTKLNTKVTTLEDTVKNKDDYIEKMDKLQELSNKILEDVAIQNNTVRETHTTVERYLDTPEAKASNGPAPDVVKNTIRMLQKDE